MIFDNMFIVQNALKIRTSQQGYRGNKVIYTVCNTLAM